MNYTTAVPYGGIQQPDAMGLAAPSPFSYKGSHADVYNGLAKGNLIDFQRAAQAADTQQMQRSRDAQLQTALKGLQQQAQEETNQQTLANQVYGNRASMLNSLLSGLF